MKIFDTHTHLNVEEFAGREAEELQLAKEMSVVAHNIVGFDRPTIERALELADSYDQLYATIGWHPTEAGTYDEAVEAYLLDKLRHPKVVALGEIGLDYHWMTAPLLPLVLMQALSFYLIIPMENLKADSDSR